MAFIEPDSPESGSTALRVAGFALLGVAAVATVIGLGTLATESDGSAAAPAPSVSVSATSSATSSTVPVTTTTSAPATTTGVAPPAAAPPAAPVRAPLRVYNNSTIPGLAATAAANFRAAGWPVEAVGNYPSGIIPTSTVYFRPGTGEEAAARQLGAEFGLRVEPRFAGLDAAPSGLIVIVTNDYQRR